MERGFRSLGAPGLGAQQATQTILAVLDGRPGLAAHEVAPGRISASVTRRPPWALVACLATIWIAGLGLFFLLVRRTEAGEITVTDGPRGCVVTLPPSLDAATVAAVTDALAPRTPGVPAPPSARSLDTADDLDDRTIARSEALPPPSDLPPPPPPAGVAAGAPAAAAVELRFEGGAVVVEAGVPVVLGRDPSPVAQGIVRTVPGDAASISKSHLRASFDGQELVVEDLGSTNGSRIRRGGVEETLAPGSPVAVDPGDVVVMGAVAFTAVPVAGGGGAMPPPLARMQVSA
ncbi:MAG: FHA domain-containing protein [Aquihabitans sp.]